MNDNDFYLRTSAQVIDESRLQTVIRENPRSNKPAEASEGERAVTQGTTNIKQPRQPQIRTAAKGTTCYGCGGVGHMQTQCPNNTAANHLTVNRGAGGGLQWRPTGANQGGNTAAFQAPALLQIADAGAQGAANKGKGKGGKNHHAGKGNKRF